MRTRITILMEFLGTVLIASTDLLVPVAGRATEPAPGWHPARASYARLADIPSHEGRFRATLQFDTTARGGTFTGEVRLTTPEGTPVTGARIALTAMMPEDETAPAAHPVVTAELGAGRYRVAGLRFDRMGWWNVAATIRTPQVGDSLAFNLIR